jgi:hypothetical protein
MILNKDLLVIITIIDKCRICGTEGETIEHIISSCTVLAQSEYKKRHDIFAKIIHMNLAVKFNLLKDTQPHYNGCFFKFGVEVGVELSIVNALYRLQITDQLFKILRFTRVVRSQSILQRLLRR